MSQLTRGELAKRSGVNRETVRYYERVGLLPAPSRSASGYCLFAEAVVELIRFIKRAQSVGFSLDQIKILIASQAQTNMPIEAIIRSQIAEIDIKIQALQSMRSWLVELS